MPAWASSRYGIAHIARVRIYVSVMNRWARRRFDPSDQFEQPFVYQMLGWRAFAGSRMHRSQDVPDVNPQRASRPRGPAGNDAKVFHQYAGRQATHAYSPGVGPPARGSIAESHACRGCEGNRRSGSPRSKNVALLSRRPPWPVSAQFFFAALLRRFAPSSIQTGA